MRIRHESLLVSRGEATACQSLGFGPGKASDFASSQETRFPRPSAPSFEGGDLVYLSPTRPEPEVVVTLGDAERP